MPRNILSLSLVSLLLVSAVLRAEEIDWKSDYLTARKEASEKNKLVLIDIGTNQCPWCVKLDATTFRDPAVVSLVSSQFVALKVNAMNDPNGLAEKLNVQQYPTVVLASSDGRILAFIPEYVTAEQFKDHAQKVVAIATTPEWMTRDYQLAAQAIASNDFSRAIGLLKTIAADPKDRPVQLKSRQLLADLEQQAAGRLARARQLADKGNAAEARATTSEVVRVFSGTQAAVEASRLLGNLSTPTATLDPQTTERSGKARELLALARDEYKGQHYLLCLNRCETLLSTFADLPEGQEALTLAAEIKSNPELMKKACDSLSEQLGTMYLTLAESCLKKGQPQHAAIYLERVVQTFPGSRQADAAQTRLAQIQGAPTQPK